MRMDYDCIDKIKVQHCRWIRDNLHYYKFNTENAVKLKEKIISLDFDSKNPDEIKEIKKIYIDFVNLFYNDPYGYYGDLIPQNSIYAENYNAYFAKNKFDIDIPIGYAKEMEAEVQPQGSCSDEVEWKITGKVKSMQKQVEDFKDMCPALEYANPKKLYMKSVLFSILAALIALVDAVDLIQFKRFIDTEQIKLGTLSIIIFVVITAFVLCVLAKSTNRLLYCVGLIKANKMLLEVREYIDNFNSVVHADVEALAGELANFIRSSEKSFIIQKAHYSFENKKLVAIKKFAKNNKKDKSGISIFAFIFLIIISVSFFNVCRYDRAGLVAQGNLGVLFKSALFMEVNPEDYIKMTPIPVAKTSASYLNPQGAAKWGSDINKFVPQLGNLCDGDYSTAWAVDSYPMVITFRLEPSHEISYIKILNGAYDNKRNYQIDRKPKTAILNFSDGTSIPCEFTNSYDEAMLEINLRDKPISADLVTLTIKEYYTENSDNDDMVMSEITFFE